MQVSVGFGTDGIFLRQPGGETVERLCEMEDQQHLCLSEASLDVARNEFSRSGFGALGCRIIFHQLNKAVKRFLNINIILMFHVKQRSKYDISG